MDFAEASTVRIDGYFYRIRRVVHGGMGTVLLCEATSEWTSTVYNRRLAAKVFSPDDDQLQLRRELMVWQGLAHPNTVRLHVIGHVDDFLCATMAWYDGGAVSPEWFRSSGGLGELKAMVHQICSALRYAFETEGVLHLDIKPGNILRQGRHYAVADWGIARISSTRAAAQSPLSGGTIPYMAPERFATEPTTIAADIYSVGMMTFELFTGFLPFRARTIEEMVHAIVSRNYISEMRVALLAMPPGWRALITAYCHPDPPRRPSTYRAALRLLEKLED